MRRDEIADMATDKPAAARKEHALDVLLKNCLESGARWFVTAEQQCIVDPRRSNYTKADIFPVRAASYDGGFYNIETGQVSWAG